MRLRFLSLLLLALTGCAAGDVYLVPFNRTDLPRHEPLVQHLQPEAAWWWLDDTGRLNLALRDTTPPLLTPPALRGQWLLSLVLEGPPAGSQRLYRLNLNSLRLLNDRGLLQQRARSLNGVSVVETVPGDRLEVRLHVSIQQQQFSALTGWSHLHRGPLLILTARFVAVHNPDAGRKILSQTEADGLERAPPATTQPASRPGAAAAPGPSSLDAKS